MRRLLAIGMAIGWTGTGIGVRGEATMTNIYDFTMQDIDGKSVNLSVFKGNDIHPLYAFLTKGRYIK